jgi:hypothetical protein
MGHEKKVGRNLSLFASTHISLQHTGGMNIKKPRSDAGLSKWLFIIFFSQYDY